MGDITNQDRAGTDRDAVAIRDEQAGQSPLAAVQHMIASGEQSPSELAGVMRQFPSAEREILGVLQTMFGDSFVQSVMALLPSGAAPAPPCAKVVKARTLPLGPVRVTAHGLRIRRTPDAAVDDNIVGELHYHAVVTAVAHDGEWLCIEYRGEPAFIHGDYVQSAAKP